MLRTFKATFMMRFDIVHRYLRREAECIGHLLASVSVMDASSGVLKFTACCAEASDCQGTDIPEHSTVAVCIFVAKTFSAPVIAFSATSLVNLEERLGSHEQMLPAYLSALIPKAVGGEWRPSYILGRSSTKAGVSPALARFSGSVSICRNLSSATIFGPASIINHLSPPPIRHPHLQFLRGALHPHTSNQPYAQRDPMNPTWSSRNFWT